LWNELGFRDNPYETSPIPPTEEGNELLVGRERELQRLLRQIRSTDTHPTIEGDNGVGKTSLVSVAGFRARREFEQGESSQLFIPLADTFQLSSTSPPEAFERTVLFRIANTFIANEALLRGAGLDVPSSRRIDAWLNSPTYRQADVSVLGFGAGGGSQPNDSTGFSESGFKEHVLTWLRDAFPTNAAGGFICTIDNLELLETSATARSLLESMRDTVLNMPGLRWVLCGARGIARSAASSPRLQGVLGDPIELAPLPDELVPEVISRRIAVYSILGGAYVPVEPSGFDHVYKVMHYNLRNAMKVCQDFALWMDEEGQRPKSPDDKRGLLEVYLALMAERYFLETEISPRAWRVFDKLVELGGSCSPSDFAEFEFESNAAMRPHVKNLEEANLVVSSVDESDRRRKTIGISPRGWFVEYHRSGYTIPAHQAH
jgi:hypothetical protein